MTAASTLFIVHPLLSAHLHEFSHRISILVRTSASACLASLHAELVNVILSTSVIVLLEVY